MSACKSCHAPVEWAITDKGKGIPLDPDPDPRGNLEKTGGKDYSRAGALVPIVRHVAPQPSLLGDDGLRYLSHFVTCPQAGEWRNAN